MVSPSVTNSEQRSQPVADQPVIKPSQSQNKNTTCDSGNESGAPSSLPRRKRVLPNLGSASRRRHSSVSKENVEKIVVARCEEISTTEKDIGHVSVSTCKDDIKALFLSFEFDGGFFVHLCSYCYLFESGNAQTFISFLLRFCYLFLTKQRKRKIYVVHLYHFVSCNWDILIHSLPEILPKNAFSS